MARAALGAVVASLAMAPAAMAAGTVFVSNRDGDFEIFSAATDGTNPIQLTSNSAWDERPSLSADGNTVVYASKISGDWEIYRIGANAAGGTPVRLTTRLMEDQRPVIAPNGQGFIWSAYIGSGNTELYYMNFDGTGYQRVTSTAGNDTAAAWQSDGLRLVWVSNRDGNFEIYTRTVSWVGNIPTFGAATRVTNTPTADEFDSSFRGNGQLYYHRRTGTGNRQIWSLSIPTTGTTTGSVAAQSTVDHLFDPVLGSNGRLHFSRHSAAGTTPPDLWSSTTSGQNMQLFGSGTVSVSTANDQQLAFPGQ